MPIYLQEGLPAKEMLEKENIKTYTYKDIESKKFKNIGLLNLMPTKQETERDIARVISNTDEDIKLTLIHIHGHIPHNTPWEYIERFYKDSLLSESLELDGLIITGAPVELMDFEEVGYWKELTRIIDLAHRKDIPTLYICWAAQAGMYYNYNINKHMLPQKLFGIFRHYVCNNSHQITTGCDDIINIPHSRHTAISNDDIENEKDLDIIIRSEQAGIYMAMSKSKKDIYVTGHIEYSPYTLDKEYKRDIGKGLEISVPYNYYKDNNPSLGPIVSWRSNGFLIFGNWVRYYVKQKP